MRLLGLALDTVYRPKNEEDRRLLTLTLTLTLTLSLTLTLTLTLTVTLTRRRDARNAELQQLALQSFGTLPPRYPYP